MAYTFNSNTQRYLEAYLCELNVSLVYRESSRTARLLNRETLSVGWGKGKKKMAGQMAQQEKVLAANLTTWVRSLEPMV